MSEKEIKKASRIFSAAVVGSVACGMAVALWSYWLGLALAFVGAVSAVTYYKSATAKQRLSDEREDYIAGKAGSLSYKVALISSGALLVILGGLESAGISIPALAIFGPYFALISVFHVICYHYYERRYG